MRLTLAAIAMAALACVGPAGAEVSTLKPALAPISFLVGRWTGGGKVADTGGSAKGVSLITAEADGAVLLRHDHNDLFDAAGKLSGGFDQIMMIYAEAGGLRAEYSDGDHLIHYAWAEIVPGHSVSFTSAALPGAPVFRLRYELTGPDTLAVAFAVAPPGQSVFQPIATGELHRSRT